MDPYSEHAALLAQVQGEQGGNCPVVTWNAKTIRVLPGGVRLKSANSPGGFSMESDFQFTCLTADFGAVLPTSNQRLGYLDNALKIESVTIIAGGFQLRINANSASQKT